MTIVLLKKGGSSPQINTKADVKAFFHFLVFVEDLGVGFHPDTPMEDYIDQNGEPTYTHERACELQRTLDQCFDDVYHYLNEDIYEVGLDEQLDILKKAYESSNSRLTRSVFEEDRKTWRM